MAPLLLTLALKGAVVLALAAAVARALRVSPASHRHGVWAAAFAVLLAVPVLDAVGPTWRVGVLPSPASVSPAAPEASPTTAPVPERASPPAPVTSAAGEDGGLALTATPVVAGASVHASAVDRLEGAVRGAGLAAWLVGLWALGALVVALVWLRAYALARRLVRDARPADEPEWTARAERAARRSGLDAPVRLLRSDALSVPVAWGFGRRAVVLPPQSEGWGAERAEAVLLHEMAHLRRRDAWTQVVAQAALALHWPNPLAWLAYRRFIDAREQACDDAVLRVGGEPASYASHLVAVARELSPSRLTLAAVSPMGGQDELETRVRSILNRGRRRDPVGRRALAVTLALAVAVGGPLAAFHPVAVASTLPEDGAASSAEPAPDAQPAPDAEALSKPTRTDHEVVGSAPERPARETPRTPRSPSPDTLDTDAGRNVEAGAAERAALDEAHARVLQSHPALEAAHRRAATAQLRLDRAATPAERRSAGVALEDAQRDLDDVARDFEDAERDRTDAERSYERAVESAAETRRSSGPTP